MVIPSSHRQQCCIDFFLFRAKPLWWLHWFWRSLCDGQRSFGVYKSALRNNIRMSGYWLTSLCGDILGSWLVVISCPKSKALRNDVNVFRCLKHRLYSKNKKADQVWMGFTHEGFRTIDFWCIRIIILKLNVFLHFFIFDLTYLLDLVQTNFR